MSWATLVKPGRVAYITEWRPSFRLTSLTQAAKVIRIDTCQSVRYFLNSSVTVMSLNLIMHHLRWGSEAVATAGGACLPRSSLLARTAAFAIP